MLSNKMLKFMKKGNQPTAERQKLQKDLYAFRKTAQHGFPHKPTAIAYDSNLKLMAIGTYSGAIKVFGQPGVEFYGHHTSSSGNASDCTVQQLEWVTGTGRVLSLTTANQLVLWEPVGAMLVPVKSLSFDGKLKKVSSLCCSILKDIVWIGTEGGNVYQFDLKTFSIKEPVIYHDVVLEQVPKTYKLSPGAIESVKQLPSNVNQLLIAYNRGLTVLWDLITSTVIRSFISPGHGESVGLHPSADGTQFTWYHGDGSFATWDVSSEKIPDNQNYVPYGPDPCKSINRLIKGKRNDKDIVIFAGGMPRSAYGDHQCVSIHCDDGNKVALDFTSRVIDFFVTFNEDDFNQAEVLIVLLEEELVAYDLTQPTVPLLKTPYLHSVHASAVTCNHITSQVTSDVYLKILQAGTFQNTEFSTIEWPVNGGTIPDKSEQLQRKDYDILLTGHEDGSVRFWDCTSVILTPLLHFKTSTLFGSNESDMDHHENNEPLDDSEPPFKKAGQFDPYSDDPRFAVKKIAFCGTSGILTIAGTAGHVVTASFDISSNDTPLRVTTMNLVSDRDGFVWKGHDQLKVKNQYLEDGFTTDEGIQIVSVLQVLPPAAITCLALQTNWNLLAAGTAHGLVLFDYASHYPVMHKCTLNPNDLTGAGETLSRRKSFKKTLRESFRRLRRGRSTRNAPANSPKITNTMETRPVERSVEARPVDDGMGSMVRCLTFAKTYISNLHSTTPTLWSATNASLVSAFIINVAPKSDDETPEESRKMTTATLSKEIRLKHRAPVVDISIFDNAGSPLEFNGPIVSPHKVIIASEEQFKVYSLPQLKALSKYKLTANEGSRVRRMQFAMFSCPASADVVHSNLSKFHQIDGDHIPVPQTTIAENGDGVDAVNDLAEKTNVHTEIGLLCLTNLGDCLLLSVPELKRQVNAAAVRREDINGISSLCFTNYGEALYMMSSSEIQRITISKTKIVAPDGSVDLEPLEEEINLDEEIDLEEQRVDEDVTTPTSSKKVNATNNHTDGLTNGLDTSNKANETITSSIGDITIDSVRDHLNSTTTTLCSTTTEEIVGRLSVLSTQSNSTRTSANIKDVTDLNAATIKDLTPIGDLSETNNSSSVVVKSVITSITHGGTNGEAETITTATTSRKESKF